MGTAWRGLCFRFSSAVFFYYLRERVPMLVATVNFAAACGYMHPAYVGADTVEGVGMN